jgi:hypothetical protein
VIHANSRNLDAEGLNAKPLHQSFLQRVLGLRAQTAYAFVGVVSGKRRQVHASDSAKQPGSLPIFLNGSPGDVTLRSPFDGTGIHTHLLNPVEIQRDATIRKKCFTRKSGDWRNGTWGNFFRGVAWGAYRDP